MTEGLKKTLASQGILTYIATPTLPYHLYADEWELLVLTASLTSASLSKNEFFDRLNKDTRWGVLILVPLTGIDLHFRLWRKLW